MTALNEVAITKVATVTGIDAKTIATTVLYNVPVGKTFIPTEVVVRATAFTVGAKSVQAIASFGGNSATYDDFINSATYTVAALNTFIRSVIPATAVAIQVSGSVFKISIETGSDATTETWAVDVFGYLL